MTDASSLTVFITGATSGFGEATARRFIKEGAKVIGTGRRQDRLDKLAKELGERFHPVNMDVQDESAVKQAVASLPGTP